MDEKTAVENNQRKYSECIKIVHSQYKNNNLIIAYARQMFEFLTKKKKSPDQWKIKKSITFH